jgi:hypothetical protein
MSSDQSAQQPTPNQLADVQAALFNLRVGLKNLKMSLLELACMTDDNVQRQAQIEAQSLFSRLRS